MHSDSGPVLLTEHPRSFFQITLIIADRMRRKPPLRFKVGKERVDSAQLRVDSFLGFVFFAVHC